MLEHAEEKAPRRRICLPWNAMYMIQRNHRAAYHVSVVCIKEREIKARIHVRYKKTKAWKETFCTSRGNECTVRLNQAMGAYPEPRMVRKSKLPS
jgi:hypothetical protein